MSAQPSQVIELTEYEPSFFPKATILEAVGELLWTNYKKQVAVDFPDPTTQHRWRLMAQGWVGHIALTPDFHLVLQPKASLSNLFRMLEYAYRLNFSILEGMTYTQSLAELYERLAFILAKRILDRGKRGFYRAYLPKTQPTPYLRGRLDIPQTSRAPHQLELTCRFEDHTADVIENRILGWTLFQIIRGGRCGEGTIPTLRRAFRALQSLTTLQPYPAQACLNLVYNRLNDDYQPLHALCRFFLEHSGPGHASGSHKMVPFLINMEQLYELFVAEWLTQHLPTRLRLKTQEHIGNEAVSAFIDLVVYNIDTGQTEYVLDTKYKTPDKPANADIYQVVAYAKAKNCREAILIYPTPLPQPLDTMWDDIHVRSLIFDVSQDLEKAGHSFIGKIINNK